MILITGGTGFIGKSLVKNLINKQYDIKLLAMDMENAKALFPSVEIIKGDITKKETLKHVVKDVNTVIHLAGMVSYSKPKEELFRINTEGTKNLLELCGEVEKFIFSSSVAVMGEIKGIANENYPYNPINPYGESKQEAEKIILNSGIPSLIFRFAPVYGIGSPSWVKNLKLLEKGFPIPNTKNLTHVVHITDVVQAIELGLKNGEGIYIIADKEPIKFIEFAETLVKLLGKSPRKIPVWLASMLARVMKLKPYLDVLIMNRNYDISKAQKQLGFEPKADLKTEIKKMVEWYIRLKE